MPAIDRHPERRRRLVSVEDAGSYVGMSTKTIRRRLADGSLTGYRIGPRLIRVDLNELEDGLRPIASADDALLAPFPTGGDSR